MVDSAVTTKGTFLPDFVFRFKPKRAYYFNWLDYPESTKGDRQMWSYYQGIYNDRKNRHEDLIKKHDYSRYTSRVPMYERWSQEEAGRRKAQAFVVAVIVSGPAAATTSLTAIGSALGIKLEANATAFTTDLVIQSVVNIGKGQNVITNYNFTSGATAFLFNVPDASALAAVRTGLISATANSSINLSIASMTQDDKSVFSFNPSTILTTWIFNSAGYKYAKFVGDGAGIPQLGDGSAAPFFTAGTLLDEATKPKDK